jgi:signal transduction histidine kinase
VIEFSLLLWLIVTVGLGALLLRGRSQLRQAREGCALLDTVPLSRFDWPAGCEHAGTNENASYSKFLAGLAAAEGDRLDVALRGLQSTGKHFSGTFATRRGGGYTVEGRQTATGKTVLWLADASAAATAQRAHREASSLREMLDALPLPVWRRHLDLTIADCNRAYARALDATPELAVAEGRELAPGASPGDRRHVVIGGSRRLLEISEISYGSGGRVGFALDRTGLETAEGDLRRHIDAHADVLEGIRASVAIYGPDKRLRFFNSAFASMWGIAEDWLAGQPSFEEILERLRELRQLPEVADFREFKSERLRMFTSLVESQQELMHLPDGRTLLLSISPHPFGGLTFVFEDVTDRLALERSCNTLTKVRRATLDHLFEGIAVFGSDGRLKLCNPAYLALWGLSEDDVAGEPHIGTILEKTAALLDDGHDWLAQKQDIIDKVTTHALASGPLYRTDGSMLQQAAVPLPDGNLLLTYVDVTDTARVERALRERNEALETAGRLKSEFIASVSHELRTPLNAVIGFADILNNQYFGNLNPRQLEYCRGILASSHQLMKLINDILDLATIEAGYMALETGRVAVFEMLQTVLALIRERAASRNLSLELRCPADIGAIAADERRLKQALFNLLSNAIKFTPPGGEITIEAERRDTELLLTVADTGIGIPRRDQPRMLEKFERGARQSGPGLGLALVKSLIELHGGTIAIESTLGRGTKIVCRLPIARRGLLSTARWSQEGSPATSKLLNPGSGMTAVGVEDTAEARVSAIAEP